MPFIVANGGSVARSLRRSADETTPRDASTRARTGCTPAAASAFAAAGTGRRTMSIMAAGPRRSPRRGRGGARVPRSVARAAGEAPATKRNRRRPARGSRLPSTAPRRAHRAPARPTTARAPAERCRSRARRRGSARRASRRARARRRGARAPVAPGFRCARPSATAIPVSANVRIGGSGEGRGGNTPPAENHRLLTGGRPLFSRSTFTGCSCSSIWISLCQRRHVGASAPCGSRSRSGSSLCCGRRMRREARRGREAREECVGPRRNEDDAVVRRNGR